MRSFPLALVLALGACNAPADDDTDADDTDDTDADDTDDTDADDTDDTDDTDAADTDDTDAAEETDVVGPRDTDVAEETDVVGPRDTTAPDLPNTSGSDYTLFWDGDSLNIYWRPASDDTTAADALEYQVWCVPPGSLGGDLVLDWTVATSLQVEGSGRYWIEACFRSGSVGGTAGAYVVVRDEAGNSTYYPDLSGDIPNAPK